MLRRAERRKLQTLFLKNPDEAIKLGYASTKAKAIKGEIGEINDKQMALKQEVEDAPLTPDGLSIDLELGPISVSSGNGRGSTKTKRGDSQSTNLQHSDSNLFQSATGSARSSQQTQKQKLDIDDIEN